jgi:hypothetical protein
MIVKISTNSLQRFKMKAKVITSQLYNLFQMPFLLIVITPNNEQIVTSYL